MTLRFYFGGMRARGPFWEDYECIVPILGVSQRVEIF